MSLTSIITMVVLLFIVPVVTGIIQKTASKNNRKMIEDNTVNYTISLPIALSYGFLACMFIITVVSAMFSKSSPAFIIMACVFAFFFALYLVIFIRKKIIVNNNSITFRFVFRKTIKCTFSDISKFVIKKDYSSGYICYSIYINNKKIAGYTSIFPGATAFAVQMIKENPNAVIDNVSPYEK